MENQNQNHKHMHKNNLCFHCNELKDGSIKKFTVSNRGYKSSFDGMNFDIQLCDDCVNDLDVEICWFDNKECYNETTGEYKYENYIISLIETFILENQEYIYNCECEEGFEMTREEWIEFNS